MNRYFIPIFIIIASLCACTKSKNDTGGSGNIGTTPTDKTGKVEVTFTSSSDLVTSDKLSSIAGAVNLLLLDDKSTLNKHEIYTSLNYHAPLTLAMGKWDMYHITNVGKDDIKGDVTVNNKCEDLYFELEKSGNSTNFSAPNYIFYGKTSIEVDNEKEQASPALTPIVAALSVKLKGVNGGKMYIKSAKITNCYTQFSITGNKYSGNGGNIDLPLASIVGDSVMLTAFTLPTVTGKESQLIIEIKNTDGNISTITKPLSDGVKAGKLYQINAEFVESWHFTTSEKGWGESIDEILTSYNPIISFNPKFSSGVEQVTDNQVKEYAKELHYFALNSSYKIVQKDTLENISSDITHRLEEGKYQFLYGSNLDGCTLSGNTNLNEKCNNLFIEHTADNKGVFYSLDTIFYSNSSHTIGYAEESPNIKLKPATGTINVTFSNSGGAAATVNSIKLLNSSGKFSLTDGTITQNDIVVSLNMAINNTDNSKGTATGNAFATINGKKASLLINYTSLGVTEDARVDLEELLSAASTLNVTATYYAGEKWKVTTSKESWGETIDEECTAYNPSHYQNYAGATTLIINSGDSGIALSSNEFKTISFNATTPTGIECSATGYVMVYQGEVVSEDNTKLEFLLPASPIGVPMNYSGLLTISNFGYSSAILSPSFNYLNSALNGKWSKASDGSRIIEITLTKETLINSNDAKALKDLRDALVRYEEWSDLEEWGWDSDDVSKWRNITLDTEGNVIGIGSKSYLLREFNGSSLVGSLMNLTKSVSSGFSFPATFCTMTNLKYINFDFLPSSFISSNLPDLSQMNNLEVAILPNTTASTVGSLPNKISILEIFGEKITSLTNLPTNLRMFSFYGNKGGSFTSSAFWNMLPGGIEELFIGGTVVEIGATQSLKLKKLQIYESNSSLSNSYIANIASCCGTSLSELVISEISGFGNTHLADITLLNNLKSLTLEGTAIESIPLQFDNLSKLETLVIASNSSLTGSLSPSMAYSYLMGGLNITVFNQPKFSQTGFYISIDGEKFVSSIEFKGNKIHTKKFIITAPENIEWYTEIEYNSLYGEIKLSQNSGKGSATITMTLNASDKFQYDYGPIKFYTADGNKKLLSSVKLRVHN